MSVGGGPLPHSPLTANGPNCRLQHSPALHPPPPPPSQPAPRGGSEESGGPGREPPRGSGTQRMEGGVGRMRPPRRRLAPGTTTNRPPPHDRQVGGARGPGRDCGDPPLPPPLPPPAHRRPAAGQGAPCRPPTHSRSALCRLAALRRRSRAPGGPQRNGDTQECSMEEGAQTKRPALVPARRRRGNRPRKRDLPVPGPAGPPGRAPGGMAHWQPPLPPQADQQTTGHAAPGPWGCPATPAEHIYPGGVRRRRRGTGPGATGRPPEQRSGEPRRDRPSPLPPTPSSGLRATGALALQPSRGGGDVPPPPEGAAAPGGGAQPSPHTARPHAPHGLLLRGPRQAGEPAPAHKGDTRTTPGAGTQTRTTSVWGPRPPRPERRQ